MMNETTYKRLLKKSKLPIPMKGVEVKICTVIALSLMSGISLSVSLNDWEWFARSGSLIVVVGIYWTWRDFVTLVGDVRKLYSEEFQKNLEVLGSQSDWDGAPKGIIAKEIVRGQLMREAELSHEHSIELFDILRRRLRTTEAATLIFGTIVWGFGSLFQEVIVL